VRECNLSFNDRPLCKPRYNPVIPPRPLAHRGKQGETVERSNKDRDSHA
jgi:hypothetical protein